jgi:hypothetical protein
MAVYAVRSTPGHISSQISPPSSESILFSLCGSDKRSSQMTSRQTVVCFSSVYTSQFWMLSCVCLSVCLVCEWNDDRALHRVVGRLNSSWNRDRQIGVIVAVNEVTELNVLFWRWNIYPHKKLRESTDSPQNFTVERLSKVAINEWSAIELSWFGSTPTLACGFKGLTIS